MQTETLCDESQPAAPLSRVAPEDRQAMRPAAQTPSGSRSPLFRPCPSLTLQITEPALGPWPAMAIAVRAGGGREQEHEGTSEHPAT